MSAAPNGLADVIADAFAEADDHAEKVAPVYGTRLKELLYTASERDADIWEDAFGSMGLEVDQADIEFDELIDVDAAQRDELWFRTASTILAAAKVQCAIELIVRPMSVLGVASSAEIGESAKRMTPAGKKLLAKNGVGSTAWESAKDRRREKIS